MEKWKYVVPISILFVAFFLYIQSNWLQVSNYTVQSTKIPGSFTGFKILQLTDLHSKVFGKKNHKLIRKINSIQPDIIVATGDMLNSKNDNGMVFVELVKKLIQDYPIYYIVGNHEQINRLQERRAQSDEYDKYINQLKKLGVVILDNEKAVITKEEDQINIYGLEIPLMYYSEIGTPIDVKFSYKYLERHLGPVEKEMFNLLLSHTPLYFPDYVDWGADLVFSGHMHGGIIRLPFVGGVLSPERDYFPEYDAGIYRVEDATMVLGRGLGNFTINLRVFNRPELVVVTLNP